MLLEGGEEEVVMGWLWGSSSSDPSLLMVGGGRLWLSPEKVEGNGVFGAC